MFVQWSNKKITSFFKKLEHVFVFLRCCCWRHESMNPRGPNSSSTARLRGVPCNSKEAVSSSSVSNLVGISKKTNKIWHNNCPVTAMLDDVISWHVLQNISHNSWAPSSSETIPGTYSCLLRRHRRHRCVWRCGSPGSNDSWKHSLGSLGRWTVVRQTLTPMFLKRPQYL